MINEKYIDLVTGYLQDTLDDEERRKFDELVESGKIDWAETREWKALFHEMGTVKVPEPDPTMNERFHAFLKAEQQQQELEQQKRWTSLLRGQLPGTGQLLQSLWKTVAGTRDNMRKMSRAVFEIRRYAYVFGIFLTGLIIGIYLVDRNHQEEKIDRLTAEIYELREMVMVTLLDNHSAVDRLRAVNISMDIPPEDQRVAEALLKTLNNDPNINVRLAATDALVRHASNPEVRIALVASISRQESPIVQAALADVMLELQEPRAVEEFKKLLADNGMDTLVRYKLENTIRQL